MGICYVYSHSRTWKGQELEAATPQKVGEEWAETLKKNMGEENQDCPSLLPGAASDHSSPTVTGEVVSCPRTMEPGRLQIWGKLAQWREGVRHSAEDQLPTEW